MSSNIHVRKLLTNISVRTPHEVIYCIPHVIAINNNVDTSPPTTEVENVSVEHASQQEFLISNTSFPNATNVLSETVSEGHTSRHETDHLSVGHASQQEPFI